MLFNLPMDMKAFCLSFMTIDFCLLVFMSFSLHILLGKHMYQSLTNISPKKLKYL